MNKYTVPQATEETTYRFTDEFGDTLNVVPDGSGGILIEIHPADGSETRSVNIGRKYAATEVVLMMRYMVDATGKGPHQIRKEAKQRGLIKGPARYPVSKPGSSFGIK